MTSEIGQTKSSDISFPEGFDRTKLQGNESNWKSQPLEGLSGYWDIDKNWTLVMNYNLHKPQDSLWNRYGFSLTYTPTKSICEAGHREEMIEAEKTRRKIITYIAVSFGIGFMLTTPFWPRLEIGHIYDLTKNVFFCGKSTT